MDGGPGMRSKVSAVIASGVILVAGAGVAVAATAAGPRTHTPKASPVVRVMHVYQRGPSTTWYGDVGSSSTPRGIKFQMPSGTHAEKFTLDLSFQYRTHGDARFLISPFVSTVTRNMVPPHDLTIRPSTRVVHASAHSDDATLQFIGRGLLPGARYRIDIAARTDHRSGRHVSFTTRKVSVVLTAAG